MEIEAAVVNEAGGPFNIETVELDAPRPNEVLVEVAGVGICHADILVRDQDFPTSLPAVFGHEGSGIIKQVGDAVNDVEPGDSVVLSFDYDGTCQNCQRGEIAYCDNFFEYNFGTTRPADNTTPLSQDNEPIYGTFFGQSSFATHAIATERNVVEVPDDVPLDLLGPLGCGVQTGAGGVINSLSPELGSTLVIFGAGTVGLSALLGSNILGIEDVVVVDVNPDRLEKAAELGATRTINPNEVEDTVESIKSTFIRGADYTLETTGVPSVLREATDVLASNGACGVIGAPPMGTEVSLDVNHMLNGGRSLQGIVEGDANPKQFIPTLVELFQRGEFSFDELVTVYDFEDINTAVADVEAGDSIKPILRPKG